MPEEKELVADEEEEEEEKPRATGVSQEDFNRWKSSMDRQVLDQRQRANRAEGELNKLRGQFSLLEKTIIPQGFDDDEEEEESEDLFPKKKKKPAKEQQRLRLLTERNRQLEEEMGKVQAARTIEKRIGEVLSTTGVAKDDPKLDWAYDESDPEVGFDRFMRSAIGIATQKTNQRQEIKARVEKKKEELPPKVEIGGPKSPASSLLERWKAGELSEKEKEDILRRGRRRTTVGGSELDIKELTS